MRRIAHASIRRPKTVLAAWLVVALALAAVGLGVVHSLAPTSTVVAGTESSRAQHLANARFGPSVLVPILLEGPKAQLDKQGPQLVRALLKRPHTRALTAWDAGAASMGLRPSRTQAMIVVAVDRPMKDVVATDQAAIERTAARVTHAPVKPYVTGQAGLDRAIKTEALNTTLRAGLIAAGVLFLVLLVGLRAPLAALVLSLIGASIVVDSYGAMAIAGKFLDIDPIGVAGATVRALALGVSLSLLFLDRFREEELPAIGPARDTAQAATVSLHTAGRTIFFTATMLILALGLTAMLGPTVILTSLGFGVIVAAGLALVAAVVVMPALLTVAGRPIVTTAFPVPLVLVRAWNWIVSRGAFVTRHAALSGALATALLVALVVPALALKTGPPDPRQLPRGAPERVAFEHIQRAMGPGWPSPFNLYVASDRSPITTATMLRQLDAFETQIARDPTVDSVIGPGAIRRQTKDLAKLPKQLKDSGKLLKNGPRDLGKLENGLGQAGAGATQLRSGLGTAAAGAGMLAGGSGQLQAGSAQAQAGAGKLHAGLVTAHDGSAQISTGLGQALDGARALKTGSVQALNGSTQLANGVKLVQGKVNPNIPALGALTGLANGAAASSKQVNSSAGSAASSTESALGALDLMTTGKKDPGYAAARAATERARDAASGLSSGTGELSNNVVTTAGGVTLAEAQVKELSKGLVLLHDGAWQLEGGIAQLRDGNAQLASGIAQLSGGGNQLTGGIARLRDGAGALETGLGQLTVGAGQLQSGSGQLATGLGAGVGPTGTLIGGLGQMQAGVKKFGGQMPSANDLEKLQKQSPGLFNSGYFVLAAVQGAPPAARNQATFAVNLARGGTAGQVMVVPKYPASDARTKALGARLRTLSDRFAARARVQVAVGGPAAELADFESKTNSRVAIVIAGVAIAVAIVLMIALRAVLLPLVTIAFNLLTVAATFGILEILFVAQKPLLGGPGYIDPMTLIETFTAAFGLSLVFQVLLLARTREELVRAGDLKSGLAVGMKRTAAAATGVGFVMLAAIVPFTTTGLINVRQLMVGVAIVVLLDVLVVRPVLMPAAVKVLGRAAWWPTGRQPRAEREPRARPRLHVPHPRRRVAH